MWGVPLANSLVPIVCLKVGGLAPRSWVFLCSDVRRNLGTHSCQRQPWQIRASLKLLGSAPPIIPFHSIGAAHVPTTKSECAADLDPYWRLPDTAGLLIKIPASMLELDNTGGVLVFGAAGLAGLLFLQCLRGLWQIIRIERGLSDVPSAPGGNILIGHVLPLLKGTPWNIMAAWVMNSQPLVSQT